MTSLRNLQLGLLRAVQDPDRAMVFGRQVQGRGLTGDQRIQIYRHNVLATRLAALEAVYPVVNRLVGAAFFHGAARSYVAREISRSGDIHAYGGRFAGLLATLPAVGQLPYLPDVARLEWIYHSLFHCKGEPALQPDALREVSASRYGDLCLVPQPASRILVSDFPILHIWQVNRYEWQGDATVDLDEGGVRLLIMRTSGDIRFIELSPGEEALLQACGSGEALVRACDRALAREPDFDFGAHLLRLFAQGAFTAWRL